MTEHDDSLLPNVRLGDATRTQLRARLRQIETSSVNGMADAITGIHQDIALLDVVTDAVIRVDRDLTVRAWNKGAERLLGFTADEIIGQQVVTIAPERATETRLAFEQILRGATITDARTVRIHKNGERINVVVNASPWWKDGTIVGSTTVIRPVVETESLHDALAAHQAELDRQARYRTFTTKIIQACNTSTSVREIIQATVRLVGEWLEAAWVIAFETTEQPLQATYQLRLPEAEPLRATTGTLRDEEFPTTAISDILAPLQEGQGWLMRDMSTLSAIPLAAQLFEQGCHNYLLIAIPANGAVLGALALGAREGGAQFDEQAVANLTLIAESVGMAITRIRLLEQIHVHVGQLEDVNHQKDRFISGVSHELRTPITAILGFAHVIAESERIADQQRHDLALGIIASARLLSAQVTDLIDAAQLGFGDFTVKSEAVNVAEVLAWCQRFAGPVVDGKDLRLSTVSPPEMPVVLGDTERVKQVLLNFLINAYKYTPTGGEITITVSYSDVSAKLSVRDTGIGMTKDDTALIFEPFQRIENEITQAQGGVGIGLAITKEIVERMGGTIELESKPGIGSTFTLILPLYRCNPETR